MRSTFPCFARALIASCRVFQVSPPPGTGTTALFAFPPGAPAVSAVAVAIAEQNATHAIKTSRTPLLLSQLRSRPDHPGHPKCTALVGNCFCVDFIAGYSASAQADGKHGFGLCHLAGSKNRQHSQGCQTSHTKPPEHATPWAFGRSVFPPFVASCLRVSQSKPRSQPTATSA